MAHADIDRLLREERFAELARLDLLPPGRSRARRSARERAAARLRSLLVPVRSAVGGAVTIRHGVPADRNALLALAELDERRAPSGDVLVAQVGDQILAVLPLDGTAPVAHPLRPTAGLIDLLELRARQLESCRAA